MARSAYSIGVKPDAPITGGCRSILQTNVWSTILCEPAAKQNNRIIESLEPLATPPTRKAAKPARDWRNEMAEIVKLTGQLKGQNAPIQSEAFSLLKAAAELAQAAVQEPDDLDEVERQQKKVQRALRKLETVLGRAE